MGKGYKAGSGSAGNTIIETLWVNESPLSSFTAQNLEISTVGYDWIAIRYRFGNTGDLNGTRTAWGKPNSVLTMDSFSVNTSHRFRRVTVTDNRFEFAVGYVNGSQDNTANIPLDIIGVKGVRA